MLPVMGKITIRMGEHERGVYGSLTVEGLGLMAFVYSDDDASCYALLAEYLMVQGKTNIIRGFEPVLES